jgi:DNA primase
LMPMGNNVNYTKITASSFYNAPNEEFDHKLLTIEDRCSLDGDAKYMLRELQSKGEITVKKNERDAFGNYNPVDKKMKAQMSTLCCSTSGDFKEDDQNRCFIMQVDSSDTQTEQILEYQNKVARKEISVTKLNKTKELLRDVVSHLESKETINEFAGRVILPSKLRAKRRFNRLFLRLTEQMTILHQRQRKEDENGRLITQIEDVRMALELLFDSMVIKSDPIDNGLLRDFFEELKAYVGKTSGGGHDYTFKTKELIQQLGYGKTKVCGYIKELQGMGYLEQVDGSSNKGFVYQVAEWDKYAHFKDEIKAELLRQVA